MYDADAYLGISEFAAPDEIVDYECTACGCVAAYMDCNGEYVLPDVCPGCRAKMDGGEDG